MIQERLFNFKLETTKENLTAHGGLALMAEFNHGIGIRELINKNLPKPMSNRGFKPSVFVEALILMLMGGGRSLEDIRELSYEAGLVKLINNQIPGSDAVGDWLRRMGDSSDGLSGLDEVRRIIAYNLFVGFKRLSCPDSWLKHTITTFRWKMIQVAGRIVSHAGQVILKLAVGIKQLGIFEEIRRKTFEYSLLCSG